MAISLNSESAGSSQPVTTFTMSLTQGWDRIPPEQGGRSLIAGDLILLEVRKPAPPVTGPSGWTLLGEVPWIDETGAEHTATVFWKIIGPPEREQPPMFTAQYADEWVVKGQAVTGYATLDDGRGSAVERSP